MDDVREREYASADQKAVIMKAAIIAVGSVVLAAFIVGAFNGYVMS